MKKGRSQIRADFSAPKFKAYGAAAFSGIRAWMLRT